MVSKESLIFFEELAKKQTRIFPDACDSGYLLNSPEEKALIRAHLCKLMATYKYVAKTHPMRSSDSHKEVVIGIPVEEENKRMFGIELTVSYLSHKKLEWIDVFIQRKDLGRGDADFFQPEEVFWKLYKLGRCEEFKISTF